MTTRDDEIRIKIEGFDPKVHDRKDFRSGVDQIDNFLRLNAKKQQLAGMARVWVAVEPGSSRIIGYYALNATALDANDLPEALKKKAPRHGTVPGAMLSMLGVDVAYQSLGIGRVLMADVRRRVEQASAEIGVAVLILDVLDDGDEASIEKRRRFYLDRGFQALPSHALRMFRVINRPRS